MTASPLRVWHTTDAGFEAKFAKLLSPEGGGVPSEIASAVRSIRLQLSDPSKAERALARLVRQFDWGACRSVDELEVSPETVAKAEDKVTAKVREVLAFSAERIRAFHAREAESIRDWSYVDGMGNTLGTRYTPVGCAAVYVPGGTAVYSSSVLMNGIPARIAGVDSLVMLTPPGADGGVSPLTLYAAALVGVDRVFRIGGAQAVFAAAFGVGPVPRADVIAGPGNAYVAEAKRQAFGIAGIDSVAGPSEVLVIADGSCPADWVAADLMAQAEHDPLARVVLLSTDKAFIGKVGAELSDALVHAPRRETIRAALSERGCAVAATSIIECVNLANRFAPEHIQLMVKDAEAVADRIRNAGAMFVGPQSPTVLGDYCAGTNHVLPTGGGARFASPLGVHTFMKRTSVFSASAEGCGKLAETARRLALEEQLPAHARSAALRVRQPD